MLHDPDQYSALSISSQNIFGNTIFFFWLVVLDLLIFIIGMAENRLVAQICPIWFPTWPKLG